MNVWDNLSNAAHIDWVLDSVKQYPHIWKKIWEWHANDDFSGELSDTRYNAKEDANIDCSFAKRNSFMYAILSATRVYIFPTAAKDAVLCLVTYDHAAQYIGMKYDELLTWTHLSNDPAAILLLPTVLAREIIEGLNT